MYPSRNSSAFQPTFMGGGSPGPSRGFPSQPGLPSRSGAGAPSQRNSAMSTRTHPGQPHFTGTRAVRSAGRIEGVICRCRNPHGHGDAWTFNCEEWGDDKYGNAISWTTAMNRILDIYDRSTMTRQEEIAKYHDILSQESAEERVGIEYEADEKIRRGEDIEVNPYTTWYNSDGHRRPHLTEQGARTVLQPPGQSGNLSRQSSRYDQSSRYPGPGQGGPSAGYGRRQ